MTVSERSMKRRRWNERQSKSKSECENNNKKKKKQGEPFKEYVLQMKAIAAKGQVDLESVIEYIVDGLDMKT